MQATTGLILATVWALLNTFTCILRLSPLWFTATFPQNYVKRKYVSVFLQNHTCLALWRSIWWHTYVKQKGRRSLWLKAFKNLMNKKIKALTSFYNFNCHFTFCRASLSTITSYFFVYQLVTKKYNQHVFTMVYWFTFKFILMF